MSWAWLCLFVASLFEIGWAVGMKTTNGFTRLWPSVLTVAAMAISMGLLTLSVRSIPVGTGYAVWTGIGAAGTVVLGIFLYEEPATIGRLVCIGLIIAGVIGLKIVSP